jgi:hypothetical protein
MTIKNDTQLLADNASLFADNSAGDITEAVFRGYNVDMIESLKPYSAVLAGEDVPSFGITETPAKLTTFNTSPVTENDIFLGDATNDEIGVKVECNVIATIKLDGKWAATEDLKLDLYVNGAPNPITSVSVQKVGSGTSNPDTISSASNLFVITQAMVDAGGGSAKVSIYASNAASGSFDLEQITATLALQYVTFSIAS